MDIFAYLNQSCLFSIENEKVDEEKLSDTI